MTDTKTLTQIPAVPLRGGAVFPGITTTITIGRRRSLAAAQAAVENEGAILILVQYDAEVELPGDKDLAAIGVLATVRDVLRAPHVGVQMLVDLHRRVKFEGLTASDSYLVGGYSELEEGDDVDDQSIIHQAIAYLEQYAETLGETNKQVMAVTRNKESAGELADYIAGLLNLPFDLELELLTTTSGGTRLSNILEYLKQELKISKIRQEIQTEARESAEKAQRDYMLREQMRAIRKELGEEGADLIEELRQKIENG